ncbi:MAG: hypothetical protein AW09_003877 [Candidatus Accumulibacter phosphatis]|uniref:Uncharacterized protein n=1 Tax=Candidatus Accumulibacter phosphatis TaxID=327160 RepID=A0A080M1E3_9PROT|nr:MAG: hypothetical protein AW09_003877 [Candidatus Accumulibacter phosphatis]
MDRCDHSLLGIAPAQQRFRADHRATAGLDQRLIVQKQMAEVHCPAQARFQAHAFECVCGQGFGVEAEGLASLHLGQIDGGVGVAQQQRRIAAVVGRDADAGAGAEVDLVAASNPEGGFECLEQVAGDDGGIGRNLDLLHQDREFVAVHPHQRVFVAQP